jgi:hypothetical protein
LSAAGADAAIAAIAKKETTVPIHVRGVTVASLGNVPSERSVGIVESYWSGAGTVKGGAVSRDSHA